ncbi:MAG: response regulator transcription factor [Candidatus Melainabacteria bacterium]|nr:response regulator transcription factor [Candidatus Melainabacteria bacterium]
MTKILLVEDNEDLAQVVRSYLLFEHYEVENVFNGSEGMSRVRTYDYDVIVLDLGLPDLSGLEVLKALRTAGRKTPVIILTGQNSVEEKEKGLDAGADDYVTKPFHMKELGARIRALLRRPAPLAPGNNVLRLGNVELDTSKFQVIKEGEVIPLVNREFQLLEFFMRHPNQVFSTEALLNRVWPNNSGSAGQALRTTMKRLRKKIDPDGDLIKTVHGVGYKLETESEPSES